MQMLREQDPRQIGPYRLLGRLGNGGMGEVFLARSPGGRTVAVKVVREELAAQEAFRHRFRREVDAARKVGGEWTARVLDADTEAESPWIATTFVPGPGLDVIVGQEHGPLPEHTILVMAGRLAQALTAIHAAGLVHRDLKPSNVLLTLDGPRVIDFGIARHLALGGELTRTGYALGSPGFMSPEQVRGEPVGTASDVFGLGALLAYAATGRRPFGSSEIGPHAQMFRIVSEDPDLDGVGGELLSLITDCLHKSPEERPSLASILDRTADAAVAEGEWLPAELVGHLGRAAVRLLDVDVPQEPARASSSGALDKAVREDSTPARTDTPADSGTVALRPEQGAAPTPEPTPLATPALPKKHRRRLAVPLVLAGVLVAAGAGMYVLKPGLFHGTESSGDSHSNSSGQGAQAKGGMVKSPSPSASSEGKDAGGETSDKPSPRTSASESATGESQDPPGNGFPASFFGTWENSTGEYEWSFTIPFKPADKSVSWGILAGDGSYCTFAAPVVEATATRLVLGKATLTDQAENEDSSLSCEAGDKPYLVVVDNNKLLYFGTGQKGLYVDRVD